MQRHHPQPRMPHDQIWNGVIGLASPYMCGCPRCSVETGNPFDGIHVTREPFKSSTQISNPDEATMVPSKTFLSLIFFAPSGSGLDFVSRYTFLERFYSVMIPHIAKLVLPALPTPTRRLIKSHSLWTHCLIVQASKPATRWVSSGSDWRVDSIVRQLPVRDARVIHEASRSSSGLDRVRDKDGRGWNKHTFPPRQEWFQSS
ncbi:hypothetical protein V8E55_011818 [Tylopilus felleus]